MDSPLEGQVGARTCHPEDTLSVRKVILEVDLLRISTHGVWGAFWTIHHNLPAVDIIVIY